MKKVNGKFFVALLYIILCLYFVVSLYSCSDNSVDSTPYYPPTPIQDTACRYLWTAKSRFSPLNNLYVSDSNKIYITTEFKGFVFIFDGINFTTFYLNDAIFLLQI